jgi:hypothetical protein
MELETDEIALANAKARIEEQLGWGDSERWHTQDYESLSSKIHEKTGVQLSVATLKRLWGKIRYDSKPTPSTLNALAQFLGYENWRSFRVSQDSARQKNVQGETTSAPPRKASLKKTVVTAIIILSVVIGAGSIYLIIRGPVDKDFDSKLFSFSSKKVVDSGVPNTVVFDYDASAAGPEDSIFIQQSWDERLSRQVKRDQKQHTSIYYYPGFFEAKLRINQTVVKEHNLLINTSGWLPLVEQAGTPVYFKTNDAMQNGFMQLPIEKIMEVNIPLQPVTPWTAYYNVRDFGGLLSDDVVFETRLKNDYNAGSNACQYTEIRIQFEGPAILIPLTAKGCVSNISFGGAEGKERDFSAFGVDNSSWVDVKCVVKGEIGEIFVNGNSAVRFKVTGKTAKMVEIGYRFQGTGSVDHVRVSNNGGRVFFEDDFGSR